MISSNLHLKSSAKNGGSNWVLIQGAVFTVSIVISGPLLLPSCPLGNEVDKKAFHVTRPKYDAIYNNIIIIIMMITFST